MSKLINNTNKRSLVFVFIIIIMLFLFFVSGEMQNGAMNGKLNENGWLGSNSWWWFASIVIIIFGATFGWLLYRKKINNESDLKGGLS